MLQRSLFEVHPEIYPITLKSSPLARRFLADLLLDSSEYDATKMRGMYSELTDPEIVGERVVVVSCENLTESYADRGLIAERLVDLFGESRILAMIRNQNTAVPALYGSRNLQRLVNMEEWLNIVGPMVLPIFRYAPVIERYEELFGKENLGLFVFEEMKEDVENYIGRICTFIGVDQDKAIELTRGRHDNKRISQRAYRYAQLRKKFFNNTPIRRILPQWVFRAGVSFINGGQSLSNELPEEWNGKFAEMYGDSNRLLAGKYGLDLQPHKYPT